MYIASVVVPDAFGGTRLDVALVQLCPGISRTQFQKWIEEGGVQVNEQIVKAKTRVEVGDCIDIRGNFPQPHTWDKQSGITFDVLYDENDVIVVDKPAGLVVHPGAGNPDSTLVNGLMARYSRLAQLPRGGIVHRLDKDTSGVMIVAASEPRRAELSDALSRHEVRRRYQCVVEGRLELPVVVDKPIGRHTTHRTKQAIRMNGRAARTQFTPKKHFRSHTLVEAQPFTGRTHQIRVHAQSLGLPIVGDQLYGARRKVPKNASKTLVELLQAFPRQALHSFEVRFTLKDVGSLCFLSELPDDMSALQGLLEQDLAEFSGD